MDPQGQPDLSSDRRPDHALEAPAADPTQELTPEEFAEIAVYAERALAISEDALEDLRALRPPKKDERRVKRIIPALAGGLAAIDDTASAAREDDRPATVDALTEASSFADDFEAAASAYGSTCGRGD